MKFSVYLSMLAAAMIMLTGNACKKGDAGPEGPEGPQGPAGPPNNANVVSRTFPTAGITWNAAPIFGVNYRIAELAMPEITAAVVDSGAILVYGAFYFGQLGQPWTALPFTFQEPNGLTYHFVYGIKTGAVVIRFNRSNNADPGSAGIPFRVMVIKGRSGNRMMNRATNVPGFEGYTLEELQRMPYEQVCHIFGIPAE